MYITTNYNSAQKDALHGVVRAKDKLKTSD